MPRRIPGVEAHRFHRGLSRPYLPGGVEPEIAIVECSVVLLVWNVANLGIAFWLTVAVVAVVHTRMRRVNADEPLAYLLFRDSLRVERRYGADAPYDAPPARRWQSMKEGAR